jgi:hypothetical protein
MSTHALASEMVRRAFSTKTPSNAEIADLMVDFAGLVLQAHQETLFRTLSENAAMREQISRNREIERSRGGGWG